MRKIFKIFARVNVQIFVKVMVFVAGSFVFSVVSLYSLYKAWSWPTDSFAVELTGIHTVWAIYYNVYVVTVLWAGSTMRNEVSNILATFF